MDDKQLQIHMDVSNAIICYVDPVLLHQVFINLLSNAVKFSESQQSITIEFELLSKHRRDNSENLVEIRVIDQGKGIPQKELKTVFNQFVRVSDNRTSKDGTGLGLTISKKIIEMHAGHIWAESPGVGRGTSICLQLPIANVD